MVWQSFRNGDSDIYARRFDGEDWGPEVRISTSDANDWEPALVLDSSGTAWISWDSYHHGNYDVFLRSFNGSRPGDVVAITTETAAQFHSSVAVDPDDRIWVAWDEGGENWGKDFSRSSAVDGSRGLYNSRSIGIRVWANGRLQKPSADVSQVLSGGMTRYTALPHITFDGSGSLWAAARITSHTSIPIRSSSTFNSLTIAMFTHRYTFSRILHASATSQLETGTTVPIAPS